MQDQTNPTTQDTPEPHTPQPREAWCCGLATTDHAHGPLSTRARAGRALVGAGHLAAAGALATRRGPAGIALWPLGVLAAWFGVSHLVAAQIGYRGCPELGAIPTVLRGHPVATRCWPWEQIDRWLDR